MSLLTLLDLAVVPTTSGDIAALNLESARRGAWRRFARDRRSLGAAEAIVDLERLALQFLGDLESLDRLEALAAEIGSVEISARTALVQAAVASAAHRFSDARNHLALGADLGAPHSDVERQSLAIDQARGAAPDEVLTARRRIAAASGRADDVIPLGAVLADLGQLTEADTIYRQALEAYQGTSPFSPAWVSFQLGVLWGELSLIPDPQKAAFWYERAIAYLPAFVKARVHLSEIHLSEGEADEAACALRPALCSGDPEVSWRLAEALKLQNKAEEAETLVAAARRRFEELLEKHPLAFADHAAEFYAANGGHHRALALAQLNVANRPTPRAIARLEAIAAGSG